jgi:hypothetical protein
LDMLEIVAWFDRDGARTLSHRLVS